MIYDDLNYQKKRNGFVAIVIPGTFSNHPKILILCSYQEFFIVFNYYERKLKGTRTMYLL